MLPEAQRSVSLSEQGYESAEVVFSQVLIARRTCSDSSLQHVQALAESGQAKATVDGLLAADTSASWRRAEVASESQYDWRYDRRVETTKSCEQRMNRVVQGHLKQAVAAAA
jgi:hypothetical protein